MCSIELSVASKLYQKSLEESAKAAERESIRQSAALALSGESIRRTAEEEELEAWFDTETRKVTAALGASRVASAAAGLDVQAAISQWSQAHVELAGAKARNRRRQAAAGNMRELEIESIKRQRLQKNEASDAFSWLMDVGQAFVQGVYMEKQIAGKDWEPKAFGIDLSGMFDSPVSETPIVKTSPSVGTETYGLPDPEPLNPITPTPPAVSTTPMTSYFPDYSRTRLTGGQFNPFL